MAAASAAPPRRKARRSRRPFPATTSSSSRPRLDRLLGFVSIVVLLGHGRIIYFSRAWVGRLLLALGEIRLLRERIGAKLELHDLGLRPFAPFQVERRSVAKGRPSSLTLPAGFRIVYTAIHAFGIKTHRVGDAKVDELSVHERHQRLVSIARGKRNILPQPESIVL